MDKNNSDMHNFIWNRIKSGDRSAYKELYELHFKDLLNYGSYLCRQEALVEDAIHDVFVNLYKYNQTLADNVNIKHYLFSCLRRQIAKSMRKSFLFSIENSTIKEDTVDSKEDLMIHNESDKQILQALKSELENLTDHQREIIYLRFGQDLSYEQIADVMGISVNSSRTLLYRSIKLLRKKLSGLQLDTIPNIHDSEYKSVIFSTILVLLIK